MRSGSNPNIDDDTRARARKFVENADIPMPAVTANPKYQRRAPVVTKEELAKSGLSLRDYMNKQQGLTRRKEKTDPTAGEAKDRAAQEAIDAIDPGKMFSQPMKKGGTVSFRGDGIAKRGKTKGRFV